MGILVLASWSEPSPWIAIGIAALALVAAIAYPARANRIAARALAISEREEAALEAERRARARLSVSVGIRGYEPGADGVIRLGGSGGQLKLSMTIRNDEGDRDAGRARVEASSRRRSTTPRRTGRMRAGDRFPTIRKGGAGRRQERPIAHTRRRWSRHPGDAACCVPIVVPSGDRIDDHPICIRIVAEGAEPREVVEDYPLRIARDPTL